MPEKTNRKKYCCKCSRYLQGGETRCTCGCSDIRYDTPSQVAKKTVKCKNIHGECDFVFCYCHHETGIRQSERLVDDYLRESSAAVDRGAAQKKQPEFPTGTELLRKRTIARLVKLVPGLVTGDLKVNHNTDMDDPAFIHPLSTVTGQEALAASLPSRTMMYMYESYFKNKRIRKGKTARYNFYIWQHFYRFKWRWQKEFPNVPRDFADQTELGSVTKNSLDSIMNLRRAERAKIESGALRMFRYYYQKNRTVQIQVTALPVNPFWRAENDRV